MRMSIAIGLAAWLAGCGAGSDVSRTLGAECAATADCDERCLDAVDDFPGGFCTLDCSTNRDCPEDSVCVDRDGGVCLFTCTGDHDCDFLGAAYTCHEDDLRETPGIKTRICRG